MSITTLTKVCQLTLISYAFIFAVMWHVSMAKHNNKIQIQAHLSTYFEASHGDVYLDHDAIGMELQLYVPDIVAMGSKTLMAQYKYYLSMFNPIPTGGGPFGPQRPKTVWHFHSFMARVTKIHDFVYFSICLVPMKLFLKKEL